MQGFKALASLVNITYPDIPKFPIPRFGFTYEMNQFSDILRIPPHIIYATVLEITYGRSATNAFIQWPS